MLKALLSLAAALFATSAIAGTPGRTYYVSSSGSDSNSGLDAAHAWADCTPVNTRQFNPGDTVLFQGGATFSCGVNWGENLRGSPSNLLTLSSYGSSNATLTPTSGTNGFTAINNGGMAITNLTFTGTGQATDSAYGIYVWNWTSLNGLVDTFIIQNVNVSQFGDSGIQFEGNQFGPAHNVGAGWKNVTLQNVNASYNAGVDDEGGGASGVEIFSDGLAYTGSYSTPTFVNLLLDHVTADHNTGVSGNNDGHGIAVSEFQNGTLQWSEASYNGTSSVGAGGMMMLDSTGGLMQFNESHHNTSTGADGNGFDFDGGSQNAVAQFNYSHDNKNYGLMTYSYTAGGLAGISNVTYRYNVSQNDGSCMFLSLAGAGGAATGVKYYGNTCYNTGTQKGLEVSGSITGNVINNIFYGVASSAKMVTTDNADASLSLQGNDYYGAAGSLSFTWNSTTYGSFAAWQTATGQEKISGANVGLTSNPSLTSPGSGPTCGGYCGATLTAYQLQAGSPMIGVGQNTQTLIGSSSPVDYYGHAVPSSSGYDLGADNSR